MGEIGRMSTTTVHHDSKVEIWFEFASNYSYLSVMRIEALAEKHGVTVVWQPFLLGPIFQSFGWNSSPFVLQKDKGEYVWRDMPRQCAKHGIPWRMPTQFPRLGVLPLRIMLVGDGASWVGAFARRVMLLNFSLDRDINSRDEMRTILDELDQPTDEILERAQTEPVKQRLRQQTEAAKELKIFGAPTFFARGEMFWGNDRLDDAIQLAAAKS
jgi:2-hydroxychromene-2-carboxylate isomerase